MIHYLNLIRWKDLLGLALIQYLVKYGLLASIEASQNISTVLKPQDFFLLVLASVCIAAAGYVIYALHTIEAHKINNPSIVIIDKHISENQATALYFILNIIGVCVGFYVSSVIGNTNFFTIFIIASALLYVYASFMKSIAVISAITVSVVVGLAVLIVGVFDLLSITTFENKSFQTTALEIVIDFAILAFMLNLIRTLVLEIQSIDGHHKMGMQTLPVLIGRARTNKVVFGLSLIPLFAVVYYTITHLFKKIEIVVYVLIFVVAPLLYISIKLFSAKHKTHYKHLNFILKLVMLTAMFSMLMFKYFL